jgi:hypothetical protein
MVLYPLISNGLLDRDNEMFTQLSFVNALRYHVLSVYFHLLSCFSSVRLDYFCDESILVLFTVSSKSMSFDLNIT